MIFPLAVALMQEPHLPGAALCCGLVLDLILDVQVSDLIDELAAQFAFRRVIGFRAEGFSLGAVVVLDELLALARSGGMERYPFGLGTRCHVSYYCLWGKVGQFAGDFFGGLHPANGSLKNGFSDLRLRRYRGNSEANVDSFLSRDCEVDGDKRFLGTLIT
jgi:hypothetical protein